MNCKFSKFGNVNKFISEYPKDIPLIVAGCKDATCKKANDQKYEAIFILEISDNLPVWKLTIGFTTLTVERALSAKAIEFKETDFTSRQEEKFWFEKNNLPVPAGL